MSDTREDDGTPPPGRPWHLRAYALLWHPRSAAVVAGLITVVFLLFLPKGEDAPAHLYQTQVWREHGWRFWDNNWYAGRYSQINYSLIYYPLAALLTTLVVVTASVATSAGVFARIVSRQWGAAARPAAALFTLLAPVPVLTGTYPFIFGLALAFCALMAVQSRRWSLAVVFGALVALGHLLALLLLICALCGLAAVNHRAVLRPGPVRRVAVSYAVILTVVLIPWRAFSTPGSQYPFNLEDLAALLAYCAVGLLLTWRDDRLRPLRGIFAVYGALGVAAFMISSPLGANAGRLLQYLGVPILLIPIALRGFRPRAALGLLIVGALVWQLNAPIRGLVQSQAVRSSNEEFWFPVEAFLSEHADPNHRVSIVATDHHWEAFYLARHGVPLTRGWYRQDDFPANADLYGELTADSYRTWLHRMAVRYVFLPEDALDYSATQEAELLEKGGVLPQIAEIGSWRIFEVPDATPIATPADAISVRRIDGERVTVHAERPGRYRLRIRYTPYWRIVQGDGCVMPTSSWTTELRVTKPGLVTLQFQVGFSRVVQTVLGRPARCSADEFVGPLPADPPAGTPAGPGVTGDPPSVPTVVPPATSRNSGGSR